MVVTSADLFVIFIYFAVSFGLGLFMSRQGSKSLSEYFLSGRNTPWWLAGTGMVATTFAADTPLAIAGIVGKNGIAGNWIWWCSAAGGMLTVFFFSKLWRRAGVLTDLEFIELRYGGKFAALLRGFKSIYFGLFMNAIVIGWVNFAMMKILGILFPQFDAQWSLIVLASITVVYVTASGLWGVATADLFQFSVAMIGTICLAWFALHHDAVVAAGGLVQALPSHLFDFFPSFDDAANLDATGIYRIGVSAFFAFVAIQWWASWYPGAEPGGGGYIAQRIMSAKNERDGFFATLWFVVAHYCVRPWPWILAGLAAMVIYPDLAVGKREEGYVYLIRDILPSPLRGLLLAAFIGAYMSTLSTQLNWGASYLLNDFYRRFFRRNETETHYIAIARGMTLLILIVSLGVTFYLLKTIAGAWEILLEIGAGSGFVLILRWYWWRMNAAAELVSMVIPALVVFFLRVLVPVFFADHPFFAPFLSFPNSLYLIVGVTVVAVLMTLSVTAPESSERLLHFYRIVRPSGPGWRAVSGERSGSLLYPAIGWISGTTLVYGLLFLSGSLLLGIPTNRSVYLVATVVALVFVVIAVRRETRNG